MDLNYAALSSPKAISRQRLAPVHPEISTAEGQLFKLKKGNLKHSAASGLGEEQELAFSVPSQKSKQKRISFMTDADLVPGITTASTSLAPPSDWPPVARVTSSTIAKKKKKKKSRIVSQSPVQVQTASFARKSGPVGSAATARKSAKSVRSTSTPSKNAKTVRATSVPSTSKSAKTVVSAVSTQGPAAPSKVSTFKINVLKAPGEKTKKISVPKASSQSQSAPMASKSASPIPKARKQSTRMPIFKASIPKTAPPKQSKAGPLTNPSGTSVTPKVKRFESAPPAGNKARSKPMKPKEAADPAPTAVSIELTAGLAETLIPTKLKAKLSEPKIQLPPRPDFQICTAFPGTPEWDEYWKNFNASMKQYSEGMLEYERGMEAFSEDLDRYKAAAGNVSFEEQLLKSKDGQKIGLEMGIIPDFVSHKLEGLHVLNGYIVKGKGFRGTVNSVPGQPGGIRVEIDVGGVDPDTMLTQKEHNMLTLSTASSKFVRIGCPDGVLAADLEIWPLVNGILMVDGP